MYLYQYVQLMYWYFCVGGFQGFSPLWWNTSVLIQLVAVFVYPWYCQRLVIIQVFTCWPICMCYTALVQVDIDLLYILAKYISSNWVEDYINSLSKAYFDSTISMQTGDWPLLDKHEQINLLKYRQAVTYWQTDLLPGRLTSRLMDRLSIW